MGCGRERMDTSAFSPRWKRYPKPSAHRTNFLSGASILLPHTSCWAQVNYMFITAKCRSFSCKTEAAARLMIVEWLQNLLFWENILPELGILQALGLKQNRGRGKEGILLILSERLWNPSVSLRHIITDSAWHFEASAPSEGKVLFSWLFTHQVLCRGLGPRVVYSLHAIFKNEELGEQYGNVWLHEGLDRKKKKRKKTLDPKSAKCAGMPHSASLKCWCHIFFTSSAFQQSWKPRKRWGLDNCIYEREKKRNTKIGKGHYFVLLSLFLRSV